MVAILSWGAALLLFAIVVSFTGAFQNFRKPASNSGVPLIWFGAFIAAVDLGLVLLVLPW